MDSVEDQAFEDLGAMDLGNALVEIAHRVAEVGHDNHTPSTALATITEVLRDIGLGDLLE